MEETTKKFIYGCVIGAGVFFSIGVVVYLLLSIGYMVMLNNCFVAGKAYGANYVMYEYAAGDEKRAYHQEYIDKALEFAEMNSCAPSVFR
jgi:hypothetical protein